MVLLGRARSGLIRKVAVLLEGGHEVVALKSGEVVALESVEVVALERSRSGPF